jgi:hypothetical protein
VRRRFLLQQHARLIVHADHPPGAIDRDDHVRVDIREFRAAREPQDPFVAETVQEVRRLDLMGEGLHQLLREELAGFGLRRP